MTSFRRVAAFLCATLLTAFAAAQKPTTPTFDPFSTRTPSGSASSSASILPPAAKPTSSVPVAPPAGSVKVAMPNVAEIQKQVAADIDGGVQLAKQRIRAAINVCMRASCGEPTLAKLYILLAHVLLSGGAERAEARTAIVEALVHDPEIVPDPKYDSRDLEALLVEARESSTPPSDFDFTPPTELARVTPFAVYVEYRGLGDVRKVVVYYKTQASPAYTSVLLSAVGPGYGIVLGCDRLRDALKLRYYIEGVNADGAVVARGGRSDFPFVVPVHAQVSTPQPHFPGILPPQACGDTREPSASRVGMACDDDLECGALRCIQGKCRSSDFTPPRTRYIEPTPPPTPPKLALGESCVFDSACESGRCQDVCLPARKLLRFWFGTGGDYAFGVMPSMEGACNASTQGVPDHQGIRCFRSDNGEPMPGNGTEAIRLRSGGNAGIVNGRVAMGNARFWISGDLALNGQVMMGLRLGFVAMRDDYIDGPAPFHLEVRATALFRKDALYDEPTAPIWSPYVFVSFGTTRATANVWSSVLYGGETVPVDVSLVSGAGFFAIGGGLKVNILASRRVALFAAPLKMSVAFGSATVFSVLEPELAIATAF